MHDSAGHPEDVAPLVPSTPGASILELYRAVWAALRLAIVRYRIAVVVELGMIALWFGLRTLVDVQSGPYLAWVAIACAIAVVSPTSGLVILVGTAPFYEPVEVSQSLGLRHVLVAFLGVSVAIRLVAGGWRSMTWTAPVRMALAIGVVVALGVANTWRLFPPDWALHATHSWLATIGGAMILLIVGTWVAGTGAPRFVTVAVVSCTIAIALAMAELFVPGSISASRLEWIGFWKDFHGRLSGPIASPNGIAALAVMPVCVMTAVAVLGRGRLLRLAAALGAAVLLVAMYVTYSRAALLSLFGLAVIVAWRLHRLLGAAVLVVGIVGGILLLPTYLQLRSQAGSSGASEPGSLLVATDRDRIMGWQAGVAMWQDEPLIGQGFLAYKQLADQFGDPILSSPHNEWLRLFIEEGAFAGFIGLAFVASTLAWLRRGRGALEAGILAGAIGWSTMASFNNPFLFIQVSAMVFPLIGYGLVSAARRRDQEPPGEEEPKPETADPASEALPGLES